MCASIDAQWTNSAFQSNNPVGLSYPVDIACYPVNASAGQTPGTCSIGDLPRYTVNATTPEDVAAGILFARKFNIRLVVKDTGHDLLGRYGRHPTSVSSSTMAYRTLDQMVMVAWKFGFAISGQASASKISLRLHMAAQNRIGLVAHSPLAAVTRGKMFTLSHRNKMWLW
jgi:hypothetical protein